MIFLEALKPKGSEEVTPTNPGGENFSSQNTFLDSSKWKWYHSNSYYHQGLPVYLDNREYKMPLFDYLYLTICNIN